MKNRYLATAAITAALALTLAGCSDDTGTSSEDDSNDEQA